jgi:hypothetical protein
VAADLISRKFSSPSVTLNGLDVDAAEQFGRDGTCDQRLEAMVELLGMGA